MALLGQPLGYGSKPPGPPQLLKIGSGAGENHPWRKEKNMEHYYRDGPLNITYAGEARFWTGFRITRKAARKISGPLTDFVGSTP